METVPKDLRGLRACLVCSLVKVCLLKNKFHSIINSLYVHKVYLYFRNNCICNLALQTFEQFEFDGCDNCDEFLRMKNNKDNVFDCTSSNFDG